MERLGIDPDSIIGVRVAECGFDPYERDDGLHAIGPDGRYDPRMPRYNGYLNDKGYAGRQSLARLRQCRGWRGQHAGVRLGDAPCAQAGARPRGGFRDPYMTAARHGLHARRPATHRGACTCPTSSRTGPTSRPRPTTPCTGPTTSSRRCAAKRSAPIPIRSIAQFMDHAVSRAFSRDEVRGEVIPVYMGLIKQIDDQLGMLFALHAGARACWTTR